MRGHVVNLGSCPYLPAREFRAFFPTATGSAGKPYRELMDLRFRRSGHKVYMPMCPGCDACQPIRVDIPAFAPRKDQRRCQRRNRDLGVSWQPRGLDDERRGLYQRYQAQIHGKLDEEDPHDFLVSDGGIAGGELHARDAQGRLVAVSVCDRVDDALSSVYCYWEPSEHRRALGTFMGLAEIAHGHAVGLRWLYLGFLVRGCAKMEYKARFRPHEVLERGAWVRYA